MANSPMRAMVDVGSVIADTYTVEALIGMGGMGAVFLASHNRLQGKRVAIKILHAIDDPEVLARFKREADIAAKLDHPNIVGVIDYNVMPDGTPYLVLDYLQGETLAARIKRGPMALEQVMSIARQVGSALAAAHRAGIVHRDLKPQNVFLVPTEIDGRHVEIAKVLDFGISKIRGSQTVKTQESALLGTPQYMAPEQATGHHANVDERTDIWALGAIVYEMVCGHPAFAGASIPEVVFKVVYEQPVPLAQEAPTVPPKVADVVMRAMSKSANERYATIDQLVEALTGQPLTVTRGRALTPPIVDGAPSTGGGSKRIASSEALAQTVGSGDHAASLSTTAPTAEELAAKNAPTVASKAEITPPPPAPKRRAALLATMVLLGAAGAAVAMYFAMRDSHDDKPVATHEEHHPRPPRPPEHHPTTPPVAHPPDPPPVAPVEPPPTPPRPPRPATTPSVADPPDETPNDEQASAKLAEAQTALEAGSYDLAERLANGVINLPTASARQRANARMIHGSVQCLARNDEEAALIDLRNLRGQPRKKLLELCKKHGMLQTQ